MDLRLDDEQRMLREAARSFVARSCPPSLVRELEASDEGFGRVHWDAIGSLGWAGLTVPEDLGGAGRGLVELAVVCEELGRGPVPSPLIPSVALAALPLQRSGTEAQRKAFLPDLASGALIGTAALLEPGARHEWERPAAALRREGESLVLTGTKTLVPYAGPAGLVLVSARLEGRPALVVVAPHLGGVEARRLPTVGGEPLYEIAFDDVVLEPGDVVGTPEAAERALSAALDAATVAGLAYMVGVAERMLEITLEHARSREQFGRPIGAFQAVAHRCADMRADIDGMRYLVYQAAWSIDAGGDSTLEVAAAKAYGNDALRRTFLNAHQVHGAIGFSMEHDLQLYSRRAKAFELTLGSAAFHRERVARAMGL